MRVLNYPKFQLSVEERDDLLADYLPFAETFVFNRKNKDHLPECRDAHDQKFLNLAYQSKASYLVTGDKDLLELQQRVRFKIVTPSQLKQIIESKQL